jgi:hypothetical protein
MAKGNLSIEPLNIRLSKFKAGRERAVVCIGSLYKDIEVYGVKLDENGKHYLNL